MEYSALLQEIKNTAGITFESVVEQFGDEVYCAVRSDDFKRACYAFHKALTAPVALFFATDVRREKNAFMLYCAFAGLRYRKYFFVVTDIPGENPVFDSLSKDIYSAHLFERQIKEMFGIEPQGNPDTRRLCLHDEVWPKGLFPLRKDFKIVPLHDQVLSGYVFNKVEGEGIFEVPVGPVHAGIIGPGHFRFSVAGEPIINLETRLGFTHRGVEKIFEGKSAFDALRLAECVTGDAAFAHSLAYCQAVEKICAVSVPKRALFIRAVLSELERMYNHANDIGGIALDVGFSFPAAFASLMKENILQLNEELTGSRYLKGANTIGGISFDVTAPKQKLILNALGLLLGDLGELKKILFSSVSFMDRVDGTGALRKKTAEDLGVVGLAARACGIVADARKDFPGIYQKITFTPARQSSGDCLARLLVRLDEFKESVHLIEQFLDKLTPGPVQGNPLIKEGYALGITESWRGPLLYWVTIGTGGLLTRCKITEPSFHNWPALSFSILGDIIPDFPLCNKSFDLSYSGNDL